MHHVRKSFLPRKSHPYAFDRERLGQAEHEDALDEGAGSLLLGASEDDVAFI